ncbi:DNA-binding protein [Podospora didyma]|uniref:DNA-binding protein n=1 Tax=Podospora didyma TaxID=330526 RepID=A0AAE0U3D2_9PEZI|nr:DNA-binding protein [Podospora didyma]
MPIIRSTTDPASSLPLDQAFTLLSSFNQFLTVAIHDILYRRRIYEATTFAATRAFNLPVHQSRHPNLCKWIRESVDAVAAQLAGGHVARVVLLIEAPPVSPLSPTSAKSAKSTKSTNDDDDDDNETSSPPSRAISVRERWMFDVSRFPAWPTPRNSSSTNATSNTAGAKAMRTYGKMLNREASSKTEENREAAERSTAINWADVDEQFRGALVRLAYATEKMDPLPAGCAFNIGVELRETGLAPIGHPQAWIPSQPKAAAHFTSSTTTRTRKYVEEGARARTTPVRSVEAGPLFFECWVEEAPPLSSLPIPDSQRTTQPT